MYKISIFQIIFSLFIFIEIGISLYYEDNIYQSSVGHLENIDENLKQQNFENYKKVSNKIFNILFKTVKKDKQYCQNPELDYLNAFLADYQLYYRKFEEGVLKNKLDPVIASKADKNNKDFIFDKSQCNVIGRNLTTLSQQSLCPWKYMVTFDTDRFPPYRSVAKCTCDTCQSIEGGMHPKKYTCYPVYQRVTSLVKGECGPDGYFQWIPKMEEINVACVCAHAYQYIPH